MLTLVTGVPGSGKTAYAVDLLTKEFGDRALFVDGLNGLQLEHVPVDVLEWPAEVPDGAVVVVDEVQRKWRPRGPGAKVPDSVAALETHRHRGLDFVLITQNPRLLDTNVRSLVGRHVHIRDTGWAGRWMYEWPEVNTNLAWQSCQNKRRYTLPRKVFQLYTSASIHTKPFRKPPLMLWALAAVLVLLAVFLFNIYTKGPWATDKKVEAPAATSAITPPASAASVSQGESAVKPFIDDRADFIPRVSGKPETAPAYDEVRKVVNLPLVTGALCMGSRCKCVTSQGTDAGLSDRECREWLDNPPFDPYNKPPPPPPPPPPAVIVSAPVAEIPSGYRPSPASPSASPVASRSVVSDVGGVTVSR